MDGINGPADTITDCTYFKIVYVYILFTTGLKKKLICLGKPLSKVISKSSSRETKCSSLF